MATPNRDAIRRRLAALGAKEVQKRLEAGAYAANKIPIVKAWLAEQTVIGNVDSNDKPKILVDRYFDRLKNNKFIASLLVVAAITVGVAQFTDAIAKLKDTFGRTFEVPPPPLPPIPGDSGWLLLGDLDPSGSRYVRGPLYEIKKSSYPTKSIVPQKGELLRLLAERNVIIPQYKSKGFNEQLTAPWRMNVLTEGDYTGVKLPKGSIVEVRDVSLGSFAGQPIVVWVRVGAPPK